MLNLFSESDAHLIQKTLGGDPSAFERLVDRYMQIVHAVAYAHTGNRADAEDVAQETFLKAYTALGSLQDRSRFGPWLATTARNKAIDTVRSRQRRHDLVNRLPQNGIVEVDFSESERHEQLREHIMALEEGPREVILLHYFAGKNLRDIARILQITKAAAQKRLCRARETLSESVMRTLSTPVNAEKAKQERKRRIMAALATTSAPWKATSPVAGGASSLVAGAAAKWIAAVGVFAVIATAAIVPAWQTQQETGAKSPAPVVTAAPELPVPVAQPKPAAAKTDAVLAAAPAQRDPAAGGIEGRVVDGKGLVIAKINVMASIVERGPDGKVAKRTGMVTTTTDDQGRFALVGTGPGKFELSLLPPGSNVYLEQSFGEAEVVKGETTRDVVLVFDTSKGVQVFGHVLDPAGKPIAEALVSTHGRGPLFDTKTDDKGAFTFTYFDSGVFNLFASHPKFGATCIINAEPKGEPFELVLSGQGVLEGRVIAAESGAPIHTFQLGYFEADLCDAERFLAETRYTAFQDEQGRFRLENVPSGTLGLVTRVPGRATVVTSVEAVAGKTTDGIEVKVANGATLDGLVTGADGKPVAEALVFEGRLPNANPSQYPRMATTQTDAEGRFQLRVSPDLSRLVSAYHADYPAGGVTTIEWVSDRPNPVRITLDQGRIVRGIVTVGGVPRAKVKMALTFEDPNVTEKQAVLTDLAGHYEFKEVPEGLVAVRAFLRSGEGLLNDRMRMVPAELNTEGVAEANIDFFAGPSAVSGAISYNGEVPPHMGVGIEWSDGENNRDSQRVAVRPDGTYLIENVPPGAIVFRFYREEPPNAMGMWQTTVEKTLEPGETLRQDFALSGPDTDIEEGFWQAIVDAYPVQ